MIQNQTEILIKDNSDFLKGRCINAGPKGLKEIGNYVKIAITKSKARSELSKQKVKKMLQDLLIIQTKKSYLRLDGSSLTFNENGGVCMGKTGKQGRGSVRMLFKRINSTVSFELKKKTLIKGSSSIIKLATNLI